MTKKRRYACTEPKEGDLQCPGRATANLGDCGECEFLREVPHICAVNTSCSLAATCHHAKPHYHSDKKGCDDDCGYNKGAVCVIYELNAPKQSGQKTDGSTTKKFGKVKSGNDEKKCSCEKTLRVAVVTVAVRFPIIPTLKCTESPNILIYPIQDPTATSVIQVSIPESSGVQVAEKLFQNPRVSDALHALRIAISSVLDPDGSNETWPAANPTGEDIGGGKKAKP